MDTTCTAVQLLDWCLSSKMHSRSFSFDRFKSKVKGRRASEPSAVSISSSTSSPRPSHELYRGAAPFNRSSSPAYSPHRVLDGSPTALLSSPTVVIVEPPNNRGTSTPPATSTSRRMRAQSLSLLGVGGGSGANLSSRSRSRSNSNPRNLRSSITSRKSSKELAKHEANLVVQKKLNSLLQDLGIHSPIPLKTTNNNINGSVAKNFTVHIANSNDVIYLPPALHASSTYDDFDSGMGIPVEGNVDHNRLHTGDGARSPTSLSDDDEDDDEQIPFTRDNCMPSNLKETDNVPKHLKHQLKLFQAPNFLSTKIESSNHIPHTFAVVVELEKDESQMKEVKISFTSQTNVSWPLGDTFNRNFNREKFNIGNLEWTFPNLNAADYYISTTNTHNSRCKQLSPEDLAWRTREYQLKVTTENAPTGVDRSTPTASGSVSSSNQGSSTGHHFPLEFLKDIHDYVDGLHTGQEHHNHSITEDSSTFKAGLYVFILPIIIPFNIPPTINSINGYLNHFVNVHVQKLSEKLNRKSSIYAQYNVPMIRTPPSMGDSVADKPIYVNRVWNDSLHYIITFPKKYVSLGCEHAINVKLVPLVKDVIIKRIKFNVLERITYVSKNLAREYDYDLEDPFNLRPPGESSRKRERVIPICELKTKHKYNNNLIDPYKEEIIKCPDNNLLFSCYELEDPTAYNSGYIATPLDINVALPFLTTKLDKLVLSSSVPEPTPRPPARIVSRKASIVDPISNSPSSPYIGALETNIAHDGIEDDDPVEFLKVDSVSLFGNEELIIRNNLKDGYTLLSKALYPDSNYRHIQINHRLQVCFRISKPDPKDGYKMHHYEVVVDTPLILLSAKCNDMSTQLPKYDEIASPPVSETTSTINEPSSMFRTPNYAGNGVIIRPLDVSDETPADSSTERLPTFEEAISLTTTPIMRTFSVAEDPLSRIPSISLPSGSDFPLGPAPAYLDINELVSSDLLPKLNLNDSEPYSIGPSTIKETLASSFGQRLSRTTSNIEKRDSRSESLSMMAHSEPALNLVDLESSLGQYQGSTSAVLAPAEFPEEAMTEPKKDTGESVASGSGDSDSYTDQTTQSTDGPMTNNDTILSFLVVEEGSKQVPSLSPVPVPMTDSDTTAKQITSGDDHTDDDKDAADNDYSLLLPLLDNYSTDNLKSIMESVTDQISINQAQDIYHPV